MRKNSKDNIVVGIIVVGLASILSLALFSNSVRAVGGGWIGGGAASGNISGGGSGGTTCNSNDLASYYDLWCTGYSWVYYKFVGGSNKREINFRRDGYIDDFNLGKVDNKIAKACAKDDGGFWHLGYNMRGVKWSDSIAVLNDWHYVKGVDAENKNLYYSTGFGQVGHAMTFEYNTIPEYYKGRYKVYDDSSLNHVIWWRDGSSYSKLYEARKFGTEKSVLADYKEAYKNIYGRDYTGGSLPNDVYAFCWWPDMNDNGESKFEGRSAVQKTDNSVSWDNAAEKIRTSWTKSGDMQVDLEVECGNGCDVSFRHFMRRTAGSGGSTYKVTRKIVEGEISADDVSFKVDHSDAFDWSRSKEGVGGPGEYEIASGALTNDMIEKYKSSADGSNSVFLGKSAIRMTPGDKICETLEFISDNSKNTKATTTVCATVKSVGEEANATIVMEVKNEDVDGFKEYSGDVITYAKPSDTVSFRVVYNPAPQAVYNECENNAQNCNKNWTTTYSWKNGFLNRAMRYWGSERYGDINIWDTYTYGLGESSTIEQETHKYTIPSNYVGTAIIEYAIINPMNNDGDSLIEKVWTTPTSYKKIDNNIEVYADLLQSYARVMIPYNFNTEVSVSGDDEVVYAGEPKDVGYEVKTTERWNETTEGTYKTIMRESKVKTVAYIGEGEVKMGTDSFGGETGVNVNLCEYFGGDDVSCDESEVQDFGDLNDSKNGSRSVRIPDVPAGTQVCVAAAVYPANSGYDRNMSKDGSGTWRISDSKCYKVAKKPSVQVWGGNVAANEIKAPLAEKSKLDGYGNGIYVFGSWAELAVTAGSNETVASGAGLGYASNDGGVLRPPYEDGASGEPGGGKSSKVCNYNLLTITGAECSNNAISSDGASFEGGEIRVDKIVGQLEDAGYAKEDALPMRADKNEKIYYKSDGTVSIGDNIEVNRDSEYNSMSEMPSIVIVAKNINIACSVERIDAILIASGTINTCATVTEEDLKDAKSAQMQLRINGALYAKEIKFNRTYGAGIGVNSMEPAEIVNYDNSMLFVGGSAEADGDKTGSLEVVYTRELAPRY